jgi:hypothetical protein
MMTVNEVITLNAQIIITETNNDGSTAQIPIITLYATFDGTNMSASINTNTIDTAMATDTANAATIKDQYQQFMKTVSDKALIAGFVVFTA